MGKKQEEIEEIDLKSCQKLVRAIFMRHIKDTVISFGQNNNKTSCRQAFDFLFNKKSEHYQGFTEWCDLSGFNQKNWQKLALMIIAYELNFRPWLRMRLTANLKGKENWELLKQYYYKCCETKYYNFIEAIYNDDIN